MRINTTEPSVFDVLQALGQREPIILVGGHVRETLQLQDWVRKVSPLAELVPISVPRLYDSLQGRSPGIAMVTHQAATIHPNCTKLLHEQGHQVLLLPYGPGWL